MKEQKSKWTKADVFLIASKYSTKTDFFKNHNGAYKWALKMKCLDEICVHMTQPKKISKWSYEKVLHIAKQFGTRTGFRKHNQGAYFWATEHKCLDQICAHMKPLVRYDFDNVKAIALNFETRSDFTEGAPSAYVWANRQGVLDEICAHMKIIRKRWDKKSLTLEASKYLSKKEFAEGSAGAYEYALRHGLIDDVCTHMEVKGHRFKRALYVYEFENGSAYIGLTFDYNKRESEHNRRGPVFKALKIHKAKLIKLEKWMEASEAALAEQALIEKYRRDGWEILNSVKGGSLGGNELIWTDDTLLTEAQKYQTVEEFRKKSPCAYATISQRGLGKFTEHLNRSRKSWDLESAKTEAHKYLSRSEFNKQCSAAYSWARDNNLVDEICTHMEPQRRNWDLNSVSKEASKYDMRFKFQKESGSAYVWAQRNGMLDVVCAHMKKRNHENV